MEYEIVLVILSMALLVRFVLRKVNEMLVAKTATEFFNAIFRIVIGLVFAPATVFFEMCSVVLD